MRQSIRSKAWQSAPLVEIEGQREAMMLSRQQQSDERELIRELKPAGQFLPRQ